MSEPNFGRLAGLLRRLLLAGALLYPIVFLILAEVRIPYPFQLEWLEGGSLDQVGRILAGRNLYGPPSVDFVPFIYAPLYYYAAAALSSVAGLGFAPLRFLSFAASLGSFLLIFLLVKRETGSRFSATLSFCLFAATFNESGTWFDLARVDSLFLFFLLFSLYLVRFGRSAAAHALAGVWIASACLTKQIGVIAVLSLTIYYLLWERRWAPLFIGITFGLLGGATLILNSGSGGWFWYYVFDLPHQHSWWPRNLVYFWTHDLGSTIPIAALGACFYLLVRLQEGANGAGRFYALATGAMLGIAFASRLNSGSFRNVLLPAFAILCVLFGLGVDAAGRLIRTAPSRHQGMLEVFLYLVCLAQFGALFYDPFKKVPSRDDLEAGRKLVRIIADLPGRVFIPSHPYLLLLAGRETHVHEMAMNDILLFDRGTVRDRMVAEMKKAISERYFEAVILEDSFWFKDDIERCYRERGEVFDNERVFWPVAGWQTRPHTIYVARSDGPCG
jgi:Dolichyl-phosphate-mannose-protein mannosyltransferase